MEIDLDVFDNKNPNGNQMTMPIKNHIQKQIFRRSFSQLLITNISRQQATTKMRINHQKSIWANLKEIVLKNLIDLTRAFKLDRTTTTKFLQKNREYAVLKLHPPLYWRNQQKNNTRLAEHIL